MRMLRARLAEFRPTICPFSCEVAGMKMLWTVVSDFARERSATVGSKSSSPDNLCGSHRLYEVMVSVEPPQIRVIDSHFVFAHGTALAVENYAWRYGVMTRIVFVVLV